MLRNVFRNEFSMRAEITANWKLLEEKDGLKKKTAIYHFLLYLNSLRRNILSLLFNPLNNLFIAYIAQLKQSLDENEGSTRSSLDVMDAELKSADEQL